MKLIELQHSEWNQHLLRLYTKHLTCRPLMVEEQSHSTTRNSNKSWLKVTCTRIIISRIRFLQYVDIEPQENYSLKQDLTRSYQLEWKTWKKLNQSSISHKTKWSMKEDDSNNQCDCGSFQGTKHNIFMNQH